MRPVRLPILRYHVPVEHRDEHLDECISICRECGFEEVLLFSVDYLHDFYFDDAELDAHMRHLALCAERIRDAGLVFSLNVMHTLGHLRVPDQIVTRFGFDRQIAADGHPSVHPAHDPQCRRLRDHMAKVYARYAGLNPRLLFVDDDFRVDIANAYHHDRVMEAASLLGCSPSRQAVAARVRREDGVARNLLRDLVSRDLAEFAAALEAAAHEVAPSTRLGLMFADGVDFDVVRIVRALAGPHTPYARPQVPLYREDRAVADYPAALWSISKWRSILGEDVEIFPECENYSYTDYTKSGPAAVAHLAASFARGESSPAVSLGSFATTVPAGESRRMIEAVAKRRGQFQRLAHTLVGSVDPAGIPLQTSGRANLELLGLPFDAYHENRGTAPVVVFGPPHHGISGGLGADAGFLLDIDALRAISASGLIDGIGLRPVRACDLGAVGDVVFDRGDRPGRQERFGLYYFVRNLGEPGHPLIVEAKDAGEWCVSAWITDSPGAPSIPFAVRWRAPSDARFAFVNISHASWPPHAWLHPWFARLMAEIIEWVTGVQSFALIEDRAGVTLQLCRVASSGQVLMTLSNFSTAEYDGVPVSLSPEAAERTYEEVTPEGICRPLGEPQIRSDGRFTLVVPGRLPCLDVRFILAS